MPALFRQENVSWSHFGIACWVLCSDIATHSTRKSGKGKRKYEPRRLLIEPCEVRKLMTACPLQVIGLPNFRVLENAQDRVLDLAPAFRDSAFPAESLTYHFVSSSNAWLMSSLQIDAAQQRQVFSCAPRALDSTLVTVEATDPAGNSAEVSFQVDVVTSLPQPPTAEAGGGTAAVSQAAATAGQSTAAEPGPSPVSATVAPCSILQCFSRQIPLKRKSSYAEIRCYWSARAPGNGRLTWHVDVERRGGTGARANRGKEPR